MITKQQLSERYNSKSIDELETIVKQRTSDFREAQIEMISILYYLKTSGRYKENKRYAKSSWTVYIEEFIGIRAGTFDEHARAIINYQEEVEKHHIGLVSKISRLCGAAKAPHVFLEIDKLIKQSKKEGPAVKDKIDKIINANLKSPKIMKEITDWKSMYMKEQVAHEITKRLLCEANKENKELRGQIERLKVSAGKFDVIRSTVERFVEGNRVSA